MGGQEKEREEGKKGGDGEVEEMKGKERDRK